MMKKLLLLILFSIPVLLVGWSQSIPPGLQGSWMGKLPVGFDLRVVFNFEVKNDSIFTTIDSPDQGVKGIKAENTSYINGQIKVEIPAIKSSFTGIYVADSNLIRGAWIQGGIIPLVLNKVDTVIMVTKKQHPVLPYPYNSEEVVFENKKADSVFLAGTITIPPGAGPFNAVILVSGSGAQDRDEFILGHSPFLVLSDYLTRSGIIVLRYDDRVMVKVRGIFIRQQVKILQMMQVLL